MSAKRLPAGAIDAKRGSRLRRTRPSNRAARSRCGASGLPRVGTRASRRRGSNVVVDPDDGEIGRGDEPLLDRRVVLHRPVPVEMVRRDVEEDADRRPQARREVDLERRHLDDMDAVARRRLERQDRRADVAAHLHVAAGLAQDVGDQRRRGRLAVGAGDGDERRVRRELRALAAEQLDVADDLDAGGLRRASPTSAARDGSAARRARGRARRSATSRRCAGRRSRSPALRPCAIAAALSSQATTRAPPACSASAVASPEPPRPNSATVRPAKVVAGVMRQRSRSPALLILRCERSGPRRTQPGQAAVPNRRRVLRGSSLALLAPQHEESGGCPPNSPQLQRREPDQREAPPR